MRAARGTGAGATSKPAPPARGILVVDDMEPLRRACAVVLERAGYRVQEAGSGVEALALLRESAHAAAAVMVLDLTLPDLSGHDTYAALRDLPQPPQVVFVSGYDEAALSGLGPAPDWTFLQKPFTAAELLAAIREMELRPRCA